MHARTRSKVEVKFKVVANLRVILLLLQRFEIEIEVEWRGPLSEFLRCARGDDDVDVCCLSAFFS